MFFCHVNDRRKPQVLYSGLVPNMIGDATLKNSFEGTKEAPRMQSLGISGMENSPVVSMRPVEEHGDRSVSAIPQLASFDGQDSSVRNASNIEIGVPGRILYVSRDDILAVADRTTLKRTYESDSSDTDSEYNYLLGPTSKRRKKDSPEWRKRHGRRALRKPTKLPPMKGPLKIILRVTPPRVEYPTNNERPTRNDEPPSDSSLRNQQTNVPWQRTYMAEEMNQSPRTKRSHSESRTVRNGSNASHKTPQPQVNALRQPESTPSPEASSTASIKTTSASGRSMITPSKVASPVQKLLYGYPGPNEPYPNDYSLSELCSTYPNHLFGNNLHPFLQHGWSGARIVGAMPYQGNVPDVERITMNAMASRLSKVKAALRKAGKLEELLKAEKAHPEEWVKVDRQGNMNNNESVTPNLQASDIVVKGTALDGYRENCGDVVGEAVDLLLAARNRMGNSDTDTSDGTSVSPLEHSVQHGRYGLRSTK